MGQEHGGGLACAYLAYLLASSSGPCPDVHTLLHAANTLTLGHHLDLNPSVPGSGARAGALVFANQ